MRIRSRKSLFNQMPFSGEGVSLYGTIGNSVQYRNLRLTNAAYLKGTTEEFQIGDASVLKTARVASTSSPATEIDYTLPAEWANETVTIDVRRYKDNVENETTNHRTMQVTWDGSLEEVPEIRGEAVFLGYEQRDGGIVRLKFTWRPDLSGLQPETFAAIRTAGPTSPDDAEITADTGRHIYYIDTPALSDASAYTYKIQAANGADTLDILTGLSITADATGPVAATSVSAQPW